MQPDKGGKRLNVRLSVSEYQALANQARACGLTMSDFVRLRCLEDDGRPRIVTDVETLRKIHVNLRRAGSNLNQCARELNTYHNSKSISDSLSDAFSAVREASKDVSEFISETRKSI